MMNLSKSDYLRALLIGRPYGQRLTEAALIFYHSEIPLEEAKVYIKTLERKLLCQQRLK